MLNSIFEGNIQNYSDVSILKTQIFSSFVVKQK